MRAYRGDFYQLSWCIYAHCTSLAVAFAKNAESERNLLVDASNLASRAVELEFSSNFGWLEPDSKTFKWWSWSRNLKFGFRFHRQNLWGKRVVQIIQCNDF